MLLLTPRTTWAKHQQQGYITVVSLTIIQLCQVIGLMTSPEGGVTSISRTSNSTRNKPLISW